MTELVKAMNDAPAGHLMLYIMGGVVALYLICWMLINVARAIGGKR